VQASAEHNGLVIVGTIMKPSRAADFCERGLVHIMPSCNVMFSPVDLCLPLESQAFLSCPSSKRILLVKATDFLEVDDESGEPYFEARLCEVGPL
jgi:hypothetical protein